MGDRSDALTAFQSALQLDPSLVRVWCELAALEEEQHHWTSARAAYERALDLLPTYAPAALALADLIRRHRIGSGGHSSVGPGPGSRSL